MHTSKIFALFVVLAMASGPTETQAGELIPILPAPENAVTLTYDPSTGNLSYDGNGVEVTTMEIKSAGSLFIPAGKNPDVGNGPFDVMTAAKFFFLTTAGVSRVDIGPILPAGMTIAAVIEDLDVGGSLYPAGVLSDAPNGGPYLFLPEPGGAMIFVCGLLSLVGFRRKS